MLAARAPAKTGATIPVSSRRPRRAPIGRPGISIAAMQAALTRSQQTRTRRAGKRSESDERAIPPTAYGRNEQTRTSADSSGEPVRSKTRIDSATWAATVPAIETAWATKTLRSPGTRRTARYPTGGEVVLTHLSLEPKRTGGVPFRL